MFTQTHILLNAALFAKKGNGGRNAAAIAGAIVPDCDVWMMFVVERIKNTPGCEIFHYRFLEAPWTSLQAIINSFPVYGLLAAMALSALPNGAGIAVVTGRVKNQSGMSQTQSVAAFILVFAASALVHICIDFLLHHEDARRQFWPLSEWIFRSPLSYWDPNYFGNYFAIFEIGLGILLAIILLRRFATGFIKVSMVVLCVGYIGPIYASFFGAADHYRGPGSCETVSAATIGRR